MAALYFKLFVQRFKFSSYEYSFGQTSDNNLEGSLPVFRSHRKNLIDIEYNFGQSAISIDFLIREFAEAILSFIRLLLAVKSFGRGGLTDSAAAVE